MKKQYSEITYLRGIAILMVLLYHSVLVYPINLQEIDWCYQLHLFLWYVEMPLFFLVSGFCYSYDGNYGRYLWKKCKRILIPHLVFGALDLAMRILPSYLPALKGLVNQEKSLQDGVMEFLIYGGEDLFLLSLFIISALFPLLDWLMKKSMIARVAICLLAVFVYLYQDQITGVMALSYAAQFFLFYLAGFLIRCHDYESIRTYLCKKVVLLIAVLLTGLLFWLVATERVQNVQIMRLAVMMLALAGTVVCLNFAVYAKGFVAKMLQIAGDYSLQLYLLDGYMLVVSRKLIVSVLAIEQPALIILGNFIVDFAILALVVHFIIRKVRVFSFLSGLPDRRSA